MKAEYLLMGTDGNGFAVYAVETSNGLKMMRSAYTIARRMSRAEARAARASAALFWKGISDWKIERCLELS